MASAMTPRIVEQAGFAVVGIAARTNNAKEMSGQGIIPQQWDRFMKEGLLSNIPNRVGDTIYALYTGYARDRNSDYDFVIGVRVSAATSIAPGMVLKPVPAGKYAVIVSEKGPGFQVVPAAWQRVWQMEDMSQLGAPRAYLTDFEVYDHRAQDPQAAQVDLYIGIK
jgi:predicted transcriptional regulator YdeE